MFDMISNQATGFACTDVSNRNFRVWAEKHQTTLFGLYVKITGCSAGNPFEKTVEFSVKVNDPSVVVTNPTAVYTIN